jgi:hypothetical protein
MAIRIAWRTAAIQILVCNKHTALILPENYAIDLLHTQATYASDNGGRSGRLSMAKPEEMQGGREISSIDSCLNHRET